MILKLEDFFTKNQSDFIMELRQLVANAEDLEARVTSDRNRLKELEDDWGFRIAIRITNECLRAANDNGRLKKVA